MRADNKLLLDVEMKLDCQECRNEEEITHKLHSFGSQLPGRERMAVRLVLNPAIMRGIDQHWLEAMAAAEGFAWGKAEAGEYQLSGMAQDLGEDHNTVLLCRNLRSGQKFYFRGNVVILGDVNPGAEVIAGGNIIVVGALRGLAHAGRFGDTSALVSAYRLCPTQLRISDHITRPPDGETMEVHTPEVARIREGQVVIEPMKM